MFMLDIESGKKEIGQHFSEQGTKLEFYENSECLRENQETRQKACDSSLQNIGWFCHVISSSLQVYQRGVSLPDYSLKWLLSVVYVALWRNMVLLCAACSWDCAFSSLILRSISGLSIWIQVAIAWGFSPPHVLSLFLHVPTTSKAANNEKKNTIVSLISHGKPFPCFHCWELSVELPGKKKKDSKKISLVKLLLFVFLLFL